MDDPSLIFSGKRPGFRLHKLEVYNWGTFDSSDGRVHSIRPEGATTLLIGQNASGKSADRVFAWRCRDRLCTAQAV